MQLNLLTMLKPQLDMPPEYVDILGKIFKVMIMEPNEDESSDGYMSLHEQKIGIRLQPAVDYNHDTLFHEIIHGVDEILHLRLKENQVHQLAAGLIAVLKQNKELTNWLLKNDS